MEKSKIDFVKKKIREYKLNTRNLQFRADRFIENQKWWWYLCINKFVTGSREEQIEAANPRVSRANQIDPSLDYPTS